MTMTSFGARAALLSSLLLPIAALASEPASHDVTAPATAGQTVVVEWTGTALPGATGTATEASTADPSLGGCLPAGPDDSHTINLTVPPGAGPLTADFHIEWQRGSAPDPVLGWSDPDLKLTVYRDTTEFLGYSDGGEPEENVSVSNPTSASYSAVVCPFLASQPTAYHGRLTLTSGSAAVCVSDQGHTHSNSTVGSSSGGVLAGERPSLPNYDLFRVESATLTKAIPTDAHGRYLPATYDRGLGTPTFLWARTDAPVAAVGPLNAHDLLVARARSHLRDEAKELHLSFAQIDAAEPYDAQFNGDGPAVVRFHQRVGGVEVFGRSLNVLLNRSYQPIAVSGYFAPASPPLADGVFAVSAPQAIAAAWGGLGGQIDAGALQLLQTRGEWQLYSRPQLQGSHQFERSPRVKKIFYAHADGLEPAYYVEIFANATVNGQLIAYAFAVSAVNGRVLHRENLKADAGFSYRVFADPADSLHQPFDTPLGNGYDPFPGHSKSDRPARIGASTSLFALDNSGIVTGDPWLPEGATQTIGNHVDACLDATDLPSETYVLVLQEQLVNTCQEQLGDIHATTTSANTFDYPVAADEDPTHANAKSAAIVNLFYMNNWLHDWWYNHGFNEVAGNAQTSNYGRGGAEGDPVLAQGQDGSGRDNANMSTPADGSSPVMQQYLFDGMVHGEVRVVAPSDSGPLAWNGAAFGSKDYDLTQDVVLADDGYEQPTDGCGPAVQDPGGLPVPPPNLIPAPPQSSLSGKIALVDRGTCTFSTKAKFARLSGAAALIIVNNVDGPIDNFVMVNGDIPVTPPAPVPAVYPTDPVYNDMPIMLIRKDTGDALKTLLAQGAMTMHLARAPAVDIDGTLDNQVIAHEYFHYVHHRLTSSSNQQANAMSEGWGDIDSFMLTVRPDDRAVPGNDLLQGAYPLALYVSGTSLFGGRNYLFYGIRRAPYSSSFDDNAFTFKHISDGEPTPDGGDGSSNSEVHNAGEIWANMMFECYTGVQNNPRNSYGEARSKMQDYIIGGFKMTPVDATYTEARDAVMSVALASDFEDFKRCSHGFAKRGAGLKAVAPARSSTDLTGVVEDYSEFVCGAKSLELATGNASDSHGLILGGAFGFATLLPLFGVALLPRRRRRH